MMAGNKVGGQVPGFAGGTKGVNFNRNVTVADSTFATITVTFPRSTKPSALIVSISAGAGAVQIQGNGVELYAGAVSPNVPLYLAIPGFPETTSINVQVEQFASSYLSGTVYYA